MATTTPRLSTGPSATPTQGLYSDPALDPKTSDIDIHFGLLIATHIVALCLTTLCVGLRIHVRRVIVKDIALDDWVLMAAQASFVFYVFFMIGFGTNIEVNGLQKVYWTSLRMASTWEIPLVLTMVLIRAAIATFFLRVLPAEKKAMRMVIIAIFWIYAVFMLIFMFVNVWQCGNPLSKKYGYHPHCLDGQAEEILPIAVRIVTMVLDWIMTMVPVIVILRSALSRRSKISVTCLMLLGGAGSTISVLTIVYNDLGSFYGPKSFADFIIYSILSLLENAVAIMVVSLAALRPLFRRLSDGASRSRASSSTSEQIWFGPGAVVRVTEPAGGYHEDNVVLLDRVNVDGRVDAPKHPNTFQ
ncbi:hypothetical protein K461DRAFT_289803 [Myriangium duriaei CBS 260.36]|uniref:Rhodopsin domain-containing protein n=1 Tax=Myriangium duriaei CBS 260.36 TaxID=1168546 RepID=A0A9P4J8W4_9PEZI|nr:hypothetical protein K461DRAFT_289803 [Myriangium duriaei CBS 260.36]